MTDASFRRFLTRSLQLLEREAPRAASALATALAPVALGVTIDDERLLVCARGGRLETSAGGELADVELCTSRRALQTLLAGEQTLLDAVLSDELELRGELSELLVADECLKLYLHGAVRSPSFPALLEEFMSPRTAPAEGHSLH